MGPVAFGLDSAELAPLPLRYLPDQRRRFGLQDEEESWLDFALC
jgi:hypothetical protein